MDGSPHAMELIKGQRNGRAVWRIERPGAARSTLKTWPIFSKCLLTIPLGISQPQRQRRGAARLRELGIPTPSIISGPKLAGRMYVLELEWIEGRTALDRIQAGDMDPRHVSQVAGQIGRHVAAIAAAGYVHRDCKLSNIIIQEHGDEVRAWMIDTVGVRRSSSRTIAAARMFERLQVEISQERHLASGCWFPLLRAGLSSMPSAARREVCALLRAHLSQ